MMFVEMLRVAAQSIRANFFRAFLTMLGIILGGTASTLLANLASWQTPISVMAVSIAFVFSAGVGLFFGIWPAHKAASLDPIAALRYE